MRNLRIINLYLLLKYVYHILNISIIFYYHFLLALRNHHCAQRLLLSQGISFFHFDSWQIWGGRMQLLQAMRICTPRADSAQFHVLPLRHWPLSAILGTPFKGNLQMFLWLQWLTTRPQDYTVRAKELLTSPALVGLEVLAHAEWSIAIFESLWLIALVISSAMNRRVSHFKQSTIRRDE